MNYTAAECLNQLWLHIDGAYAPNTIRAYRTDMNEFVAHCVGLGRCPLPADPIDVVDFLVAASKTGIKSSTVRRKVSSISAVHRLSNVADPTKHPEVRLCVRRINRQLGVRFDQAFPITRQVLDELLACCGDDLRGARNQALLLLAYDSMRRRSELVSLRIEDLLVNDKGTSTLLLRRSKTDQFGSGQWLHLSQETTAKIQRWLEISKLDSGLLIRSVYPKESVGEELDVSQINKIYKSLARRAKFKKEVIQSISGHSTRVGAAQDLLIKGATLPQIMVKGGWSKTDTVIRYIEKVRPPSFETH
jgi:site-specific recombinase XerD